MTDEEGNHKTLISFTASSAPKDTAPQLWLKAVQQNAPSPRTCERGTQPPIARAGRSPTCPAGSTTSSGTTKGGKEGGGKADGCTNPNGGSRSTAKAKRYTNLCRSRGRARGGEQSGTLRRGENLGLPGSCCQAAVALLPTQTSGGHLSFPHGLMGLHHPHATRLS